MLTAAAHFHSAGSAWFVLLVLFAACVVLPAALFSGSSSSSKGEK